MEFRNRLIKERNSKGLTQEELAEKCNVNVRTIQRIESGRVQPRAHTIKVISETLGFDFFSSIENNEHSIIWQIKDLFNLKTQKMKKVSILTLTGLIVGLTTIAVANKNQAEPVAKEKPKSGITIAYDEKKAIQRIDVVFTNQLNLDSLLNIVEILKNENIVVNYRQMEFDKKGQLTSINCEVSKNGSAPAGSFSVKNLNSVNKGNAFGFYYDYAKNAESSFCTGSCW